MKKIYTLLIAVCLSIVLFSHTGLCIAVSSNQSYSVDTQTTKNTKKYNLIDLVRLKKYVAGYIDEVGDADYNKDGFINAMDLVALRKLILGLPINSDGEKEDPKLDDDGYYNEVVKP